VVSEDDLKIDLYRASGAGRGSWAVRLTHLPSGTVVAAEGEFRQGDDPEPAILQARADLLVELEARLKDA
jgi:protein subunit release factor A